MPVVKVSSGLDRIMDSSQDVEELGSGFGGEYGPARVRYGGRRGGYLLFSDIHNNRRMKWAPGQEITVNREPSDRAQRPDQGYAGQAHRLRARTRRVTRLEPDGSITVVANSYRGWRLNRPNDVVVKSDGSIYFTDPMTMNVVSELDFAGVYRVSPDLGTINCIVRDFVCRTG